MTDQLTTRQRLGLRILFWCGRVILGSIPFNLNNRDELKSEIEEISKALAAIRAEDAA